MLKMGKYYKCDVKSHIIYFIPLFIENGLWILHYDKNGDKKIHLAHVNSYLGTNSIEISKKEWEQS